jgi:methyl-accepting chemotaxis protein
VNGAGSHDRGALKGTQTGGTASAMMARAAEVCRAAAGGDLEARVLNVDPADPAADMAHAINQLLDMTDAFVREATATLDHSAHDQYHRRVVLTGTQGSFRLASETINSATALMADRSKRLKTAEARRRELASEFGATIDSVHNLAEASTRIATASGAIKKIADKTNMLALNATIEAARAGEAGRGFAVVASEVQRLSKQTTEATTQIETLLKDIQAATAASVRAVELIRKSLEEDKGAGQSAGRTQAGAAGGAAAATAGATPGRKAA